MCWATSILLLLCSGCVASYQHYSDPRIDNDGRDLLCLGVVKEVKTFEARVDICDAVDPVDGEVIHAEVNYRFDPRNLFKKH